MVGDIKGFTTKEFQFMAVDMGFSVKWANANLGADSSEGYGDYYTWDEAQTAPPEGWRVPTASEIDELMSSRNNASYQWEWKSVNGHNGWLVTYLVNNSSIFLPAAGGRDGTSLYYVGLDGDYWSSSLDEGSSELAWGLYFNSDYVLRYNSYRSNGFPVRAVTE